MTEYYEQIIERSTKMIASALLIKKKLRTNKGMDNSDRIQASGLIDDLLDDLYTNRAQAQKGLDNHKDALGE